MVEGANLKLVTHIIFMNNIINNKSQNSFNNVS